MVGVGIGLLLLRRHKQQQPPAARGPLNIPEVYGNPCCPLTAAALSKQIDISRQQQQQRLLALGVPAAAAEAAAEAAAAAAAAEIPSSAWAEEVAAANPSVGPPAALLAAAKSGAPLEFHVHLKTLFCATLKAAILGDLAASQQQQNRRSQQQPQQQHQQQQTPEVEMPRLLQQTESVFKDVFYDPEIRAAASGVDFAQPVRELMLELQQLPSNSKTDGNSNERPLLPLLLTKRGRQALDRFIAAVDKQVLNSLCTSWASSGMLQQQQQQQLQHRQHQQQQQQQEGSSRVRQLSALSAGKDAGTPMALASYADAANR